MACLFADRLKLRLNRIVQLRLFLIHVLQNLLQLLRLRFGKVQLVPKIFNHTVPAESAVPMARIPAIAVHSSGSDNNTQHEYHDKANVSTPPHLDP